SPGNFPANSAADQVIEGDVRHPAQDEEVAREVQERPRKTCRRANAPVPRARRQSAHGLFTIVYPVSDSDRPVWGYSTRPGDLAAASARSLAPYPDARPLQHDPVAAALPVAEPGRA